MIMHCFLRNKRYNFIFVFSEKIKKERMKELALVWSFLFQFIFESNTFLSYNEYNKCTGYPTQGNRYKCNRSAEIGISNGNVCAHRPTRVILKMNEIVIQLVISIKYNSRKIRILLKTSSLGKNWKQISVKKCYFVEKTISKQINIFSH